MTGFGKVTAELPSKKVTVEIKALNSKQLDLSTRIPSIYKEKEMQIRSLLLQSLERGKVEFNIFVEYIGKDTPTQINLAAVENYYNQIKDMYANRLNIGLPADWFQTPAPHAGRDQDRGPGSKRRGNGMWLRKRSKRP